MTSVQWAAAGAEDRSAKSTKALLVALVAVGLFLNRQPQSVLNVAVRRAFGNPGYRGPWLLVEHALLSSSLMFVFSVAAWCFVARHIGRPNAWLRVPRWRDALRLGAIGGAIPLLVNVAVLLALQASGAAGGGPALGYTAPQGWAVAGNLISNFYEEVVFRGFFVLALRPLLGPALAMCAASAAFGFSHDQYPLFLQLVIAGAGVLWCWIDWKAKSVWPSWIAHELVDLVGDSIFRMG
jgi:membrane protease YdiL (CAAX protease family)